MARLLAWLCPWLRRPPEDDEDAVVVDFTLVEVEDSTNDYEAGSFTVPSPPPP